MTTFEDLPIEIISLIVDHVAVQDIYPWTLVNKHFYAKANPVLWRELEIRNKTILHQFTTRLANSSQMARNVRSIDLLHFAPSHAELRDLWELIPSLEELFIQHARDISNHLVVKHGTHLTFLSLAKRHISITSINELAQSCRQLRQLVLLDCTGMTCRVFAPLATLLFLEELALNVQSAPGNDGFGGFGHRQHWAAEMALDLAQLQRLTKLTLYNPPKDVVRCITTTTTDRAGNPAWSRLTHIYLERCDDVDDPAMTRFIESHRLLQSIVLVQGKFTDATLVTISNCLSGVMTSLAVMNNRHITSEGIRRLIYACPLLESVHLLGCRIRPYHFPEAGDQCLDDSLLKMHIDHLDSDTIHLIQQSGGRSLMGFSGSYNSDNIEDDTISSGESDDSDGTYIDEDDW